MENTILLFADVVRLQLQNKRKYDDDDDYDDGIY